MTRDAPGTTQADRILVVDDDEFVCNSLKWLLMDEGYDVEIAEDGKTALAKMKSADYGLVLTDLMMPEVDGLAVLHEAKRIDPDTAVIILTGYGTLEAAMSALEKGAYDFLTKPCDDGEMKYKIRGALEQRRLRRRVADLERGSQGGAIPCALLLKLLIAVDEQLKKMESQPSERTGESLALLRTRLKAVAEVCDEEGDLDLDALNTRLDQLSG